MTSEVTQYDPDDLARTVYHLKKTGMTFTAIRTKFLDEGMDPPTVGQMMQAYRSYMLKVTKDFGVHERDIVMGMEMERLDDLQAAVWPSAMLGDHKSIDSVIKVMALRAKLTGLDQLSTQDKATVQQVIIVGGDTRSFVEALEYGRQAIMASPDPDDETESEEVQ